MRKVLTDGARFRVTPKTSLSASRRWSRKMMIRRYEVAPDSGLYVWRRRPESPWAAEDRALAEMIQAIHGDGRRT